MAGSSTVGRLNARSQRGSGMLLAIIVVMVVAVIGVGVLRFSSRELAGADAGRKHESLVACADAARQLINSQFRLIGVSPLDLQPLGPNGQGIPLDPDRNTLALSGHVGEVNIRGVKLGSASAKGGGATGDITNRAFPQFTPGQGTNYIITAHCNDHGRELEIEFQVRFGI